MSVAPLQACSRPEPIRARYLLVTHIPVYCDADGQRMLDPLWLKDLSLHVDYISDFSIACPRIDGPSPAGLVRVDDPRIKFVDLPGRRKHSLMLPVTAWRLWSNIGRADLVHSSVGGWLPFSTGNMVALFAKMRRKYLLVIVESSTWRLVPGVKAPWLAKAKAALSEWMNRWCVNRVDMGIFTQVEYKASLMTRRPERGHVIHASWIDEHNILPKELVDRCWEEKLSGSPLKVLFAGRLTAAKGVLPLLDAIDLAEAERCPVHLDVIGEGELHRRCQASADALRQTTKVSVLGVVPYGAPFFALLREYHALVVPSLSAEQPRIVYDAYSQGVPVLASDTAGLRDCVIDGKTGCLFAPNDAESLKECLKRFVNDGSPLRAMGVEGLALAMRTTHRDMHFRRWVLLDRSLRERAAERAVYSRARG